MMEWTVLSGVPEAILAVDSQGMVIHATSRAEALFRMDRRALVGRSLDALLPSGETPDGSRARAVRADGTEFSADVHLGTIETPQGQVTLACVRDVSQMMANDARDVLRRTALNSVANGVTITDRQGTVLWVNPAFTSMTGYSFSEIVGKNLRLLKSGRHDPSFYADLWQTILAGRVWRGETTNRRKDGSLYVEEQTITPIRDRGGELAYFVAIKDDVTLRRKAEAELQRRVEELTVLDSIAVLAMEAADESSLVDRVVAILVDMLFPDGFHLSLRQGKRAWLERWDAGSPVARRRMADVIHQTRRLAQEVAGSVQTRRVVRRRRAGAEPAGESEEPFSVLALPVGQKPKIIGALCAFRPPDEPFEECDEHFLIALSSHLATAVERVRLLQEVQRLAITDPLTELPNRRHFLELAAVEVERARRKGYPVAALMLDADHFKRVNDARGHAAGDRVLRHIGSRLRQTLRGYDLVCRWGGEEFVALLPEAGLADAVQIAGDLLLALSGEVPAAGDLRVTVSVGVAATECGSLDLSTLIERADQALYAAKEAGRARLAILEDAGPRLVSLADLVARRADVVREA